MSKCPKGILRISFRIGGFSPPPIPGTGGPMLMSLLRRDALVSNDRREYINVNIPGVFVPNRRPSSYLNNRIKK